MGRKKKMLFKLNPEWLLKEPIDFEYNKYTLLDYLQKCEKGFDKLEIYPDFVELSLHLANLQSLVKENTLLLTNKKFESCDDEILLKELYPKKPKEGELDKTIRYSGNKLFDAFNMAKSIWNMAYDAVTISIKKNKQSLAGGVGYIFYYDKEDGRLYVWEYQIRKTKGDEVNNKTYLIQIYKDEPRDITLSTLIDEYSTWKDLGDHHDFPVFEMKTTHRFPMDATLVPIMKRKVMAYVFQLVNLEKIKNFDSED